MFTDKNQMQNIMSFKKWVKYHFLGESRKEIELNRILDKMSDNKPLSDRENNFLKLYDITSDDDIKDYTHLTYDAVADKIKELLGKGKSVIYDIYDKKNNRSVNVKSVYCSYGDGHSYVILDNNEKVNLLDKCLYNLLYDVDKDVYSLQIQDEYYELITVKGDGDK